MKTYVLDASALFIFLEKERAAEKVGELLKEAMRGHVEILMSSLNCAEVYGRILRERGQDQAAATMSLVYPLPIRILDATLERALRAAEVKSRFKLYFVDSFAAALALEHKATLVTSDSDFRRVGSNVPVLWLKN